MDAANSKSYPGTGTAWTDISGTGNHGTLANGPTYSSTSRGMFSFDGVDDRVTFVGTPASFAFGTGDFAVECWIKPKFNTTSGGVAAMFVLGSMLCSWDNSYNSWNMYNYNSGYTSRPNAAVTQNAWMHFLVTRSSSNNTMTTYYNGVSVNAVADSSNYTANTSSIGHRADYNEPLLADIGTFRVYKGTSFTATTAQQNFNALRGRYGV